MIAERDATYDQLAERNSELLDERDKALNEAAELRDEVELMKAAEQMNLGMLRKACKERDALAAHAERLKPALEDFSRGLGTCCCGDDMQRHPSPMNAGHMPVDSGWYVLEMYMRETPAVSLSQRDALKQAEALEDMAKQVKAMDRNMSIAGIVAHIRHDAAVIREQAEAQP
ncbi:MULTISPECIES: hypothetical protein [unclassified Halomonas]|uniref:hypothetical protein n=1 Tax=unclassified Halomonas TaxID=2609666 RepID=UPI002076A7DA|nr:MULTISPECIES: hypothetical protein [unclassified Halomonas]